MVSIVVPTYRRKKLICRSIDSLLAQSYTDIEIIIVDDGSDDGTEELVKGKYADKRLRYIKLDKNTGPSYARNVGIVNARGDYFMIWDSDDYLYDYAISKVLDIFNKNNNVVVVSAPAKTLVNGIVKEFINDLSGIVPQEKIICRQLPKNLKIRVAKMSACRDVRYVSRNIDFLMNIYLSEKGPWYHIPEELGEVYNQDDDISLTKWRKIPDINKSKDRSKYLSDYLSKYQEVILKNCPATYSAFAYGTALGLILDKKSNEAKKILLLSIKNYFNIKNIILYFISLLPCSKFFIEKLFILKIKFKNK